MKLQFSLLLGILVLTSSTLAATPSNKWETEVVEQEIGTLVFEKDLETSCQKSQIPFSWFFIQLNRTLSLPDSLSNDIKVNLTILLEDTEERMNAKIVDLLSLMCHENSRGTMTDNHRIKRQLPWNKIFDIIKWIASKAGTLAKLGLTGYEIIEEWLTGNRNKAYTNFLMKLDELSRHLLAERQDFIKTVFTHGVINSNLTGAEGLFNISEKEMLVKVVIKKESCSIFAQIIEGELCYSKIETSNVYSVKESANHGFFSLDKANFSRIDFSPVIASRINDSSSKELAIEIEKCKSSKSNNEAPKLFVCPSSSSSSSKCTKTNPKSCLLITEPSSNDQFLSYKAVGKKYTIATTFKSFNLTTSAINAIVSNKIELKGGNFYELEIPENFTAVFGVYKLPSLSSKIDKVIVTPIKPLLSVNFTNFVDAKERPQKARVTFTDNDNDNFPDDYQIGAEPLSSNSFWYYLLLGFIAFGVVNGVVVALVFGYKRISKSSSNNYVEIDNNFF